MPKRRGLQEGEIRQGIEDGGHVRNVLIVSKCVGLHTEHLAYIHTSWQRDYLPLRTWQEKGDRTYRDLDRLLTLLWIDFGFRGSIPLYLAGDPELRRFRVVAREAETKGSPVPPFCAASPSQG